jgi:hypothetical protein
MRMPDYNIIAQSFYMLTYHLRCRYTPVRTRSATRLQKKAASSRAKGAHYSSNCGVDGVSGARVLIFPLLFASLASTETLLSHYLDHV